jgi:transposase
MTLSSASSSCKDIIDRCCIIKLQRYHRSSCKISSNSIMNDPFISIIKLQRYHRSFVSIDETSFGRNGINIKGYSPKGTKLFLQKAAPRMTTTSVVACVSNKSILATKVVKGAFNTQLFLDFLVNLNLPSQTVVLLDNVRFHHSRVVKDYAMSQGIDLLYVPPYSPWFNPVELCFSVVKRHYYKTLDIKTSFQILTTHHCKSFFDRSLKITNGPS